MLLQKPTILTTILTLTLVSSDHTIKLQPIVIVPQVKIFFGPPTPSTSKFPPIIELLVQRLQTQFSSYVYEDLSRPPTYEKPVYTLSPEEQATATEPLVLATESSSTTVDEESVTEKVKPIEYGTLVVYLKRNSTAKKEEEPLFSVKIAIENQTKP